MTKIISFIKENLKAVLGIGLVAIAGISVGNLSKKDVAQVENKPIEEIITETPSSVSKPKTTPSKVVLPTDNRTYTELVAAYKGKMLQFGASCQVLISNQVFKLGSDILLDNRNSSPVAIKIGSSSYQLGSYGYKVVSLDTTGKFMVDCGSQQNVAILTVER